MFVLGGVWYVIVYCFWLLLVVGYVGGVYVGCWLAGGGVVWLLWSCGSGCWLCGLDWFVGW